MVKKKKQRKKKKSNILKNIALTILAISGLSVLSFFIYTWFIQPGAIELKRAEEIVVLSLSKSGIPETSVKETTDELGNMVFKTSVNSKQLKSFEKSLRKYIKNKSTLRIREFSNGKVAYIETTTDIVKVVLAYKSGYVKKTKNKNRSKPKVHKKNNKQLEKDNKLKIKDKLPQPLLAIIIDDVGIGNMDSFKKALKIPYPITFAILPFRSFTKECAELAKGRGYEMILHMPMEPYGYPKNDPGPGAIFEKDSKKLIEDKLQSAFKSVKYAKGLNNHMGSKITALKYSTRVILNFLKENNYFFIDSRTSADTIALSEARKMKIKSLKRNVFIDNSRKKKDIEIQLKKAVTEAKANGYAVAIGHNYPETINELNKIMPKLDEEINFIFVKELANEFSK